jgi:uncharacterized protein YeaO (DUF488 family)
MKFECGFETEALDLQERRQAGQDVSSWEQYREHNRQELPQLLRKRIEENMMFAQRSKERLEYLSKAEKEGALVLKP